MKFRVDWVSANALQFAVVAWSSDQQELLDAYLDLDAIPNTEGVFSSVTEESAIRAYNQGSGKSVESQIKKQTRASRASFMRMVLPATQSVAVNDVLTQAQVRKIAGA